MEEIKIENWFTVEDYARNKKLSIPAVYKRIKRGKLEARRLAGRILVHDKV